MDHRASRIALAVALFAGLACVPGSAQAQISVELAKTCRDQAIKAHPTQPAGTDSGYAAAQREVFKTCMSRQGKVQDGATPEETR